MLTLKVSSIASVGFGITRLLAFTFGMACPLRIHSYETSNPVTSTVSVAPDADCLAIESVDAFASGTA